MRISEVSRRSVPAEEGAAPPSPPRSPRRAAALIVAALVILAGFLVTAPYISVALKQGFSMLSATTAGGPITASTDSFTTATSCSSVVAVKSLAAPDISNGAANIAYPADYCTLASFALDQINADRAANGTGPVALGFNTAAQQHSDSMLYYGYFSHFDTQGYKPYMRYTLLGGRGADFENVAYLSYSATHFTSTGSVEDAIKSLEHAMVYDDLTCCNNGHRFNILDPLHNVVSIGVAYNSTTVYFDEEFENDYLNLNFQVTSATSTNPYYVTMTGSVMQRVNSPTAIYIAYDQAPSAESSAQLNAGPHEYNPGTLDGGVLPPIGPLGGCNQFTQGRTVCADKWVFSSSSVDIAFSLKGFVSDRGPGVYTIYLVLGTDTNSAITTISVFVA